MTNPSAKVGDELTSREQEIASLLYQSLSNKQIASKIGTTENTVKNHLSTIFYKLDVTTRNEMLLKYLGKETKLDTAPNSTIQKGTDLYKWLWTHIGKRPWTYIYRDIWRKYEYFIQLQWFLTAVLVFYLAKISIPAKELTVLWLVYSFGYINGHFFWGSKITEGQTEADEQATITKLQSKHDKKWNRHQYGAELPSSTAANVKVLEDGTVGLAWRTPNFAGKKGRPKKLKLDAT